MKVFELKEDKREPLGSWAPGTYLCKCSTCGNQFIGDKRAKSCADCAYETEHNRETLAASRDQWKSDCVELAGMVERNVDSWRDSEEMLHAIETKSDLYKKAKAILERVEGDE